MKIFRDPVFWVSVAAVAAVMVLGLHCSANVSAVLEKTQKELNEKRNEFMKRCQKDDYSKTDCQVKYQKI